MKSAIALAAASLIALSMPAFAQNSGSAGASGTGAGLSGSNPGTSPGTNPGAPNTDMNRMGAGGANGGMNEGRANSTDMTNTPADKANPAPTTVRGDQNGQGTAKP